ncbi:programmed cell death protein 2-like [Daktulosphaira vitifoliae]|uniref:programmed cell death protein 2-like n=1 Tax=Daktulosphaira vitifoliae TaxID=58002 RepID=UPI0021A99F4E|nr:programmed cell death protein 2-like [Daktulosphaira vitifoliae]
MAKASNKVLVGFVDEPISANSLDDSFMTNKIGGFPNIPEESNILPQCPLCGLNIPLLAQIYAPLSNSDYHRTLYIHACVNPSCWNKSESWICLRRQWKTLDNNEENRKSSTFIEWCDDADDWGEASLVEENGNLSKSLAATELYSTSSAEIENSDVDENILVETIQMPSVDIIQLLDSKKEVPQISHSKNILFKPFYISVAFEEIPKKELFDKNFSNFQNNQILVEDKNESYEKSIPIHGDKLFETFASTIRKNPGQILRYCRDGGKPLFLYEQEEPLKCCNCQGKLIFELQILPSLITYLKFVNGENFHGSGHLEYGTALIYSCEKSCWAEMDTYKKDTVIVQEEKIF